MSLFKRASKKTGGHTLDMGKKKPGSAAKRIAIQVADNPKRAEEDSDAETKEAKKRKSTYKPRLNVSEKLFEVKSILEQQLGAPSNEVSIIQLVDSVIKAAYNARASDIHADPREEGLAIRFRIDGVLHDVILLPKEFHSSFITRIKVLAGLRTDEHQAAQDGRFRSQIMDIGYIDVRVSIAPTYYGENTVMRLLSEQTKELSLEELGFAENDLETIKKAIKRPHGMILATGPTGSGKTTTLYSLLKLLNTREVSIITIEDPIEYSIGGVDQIQVNSRTGLTFATGLRTILRQDPNIIMVGEIRDEETARIGVNAALTGHLLLSSLHTNDAATTLPRLLDMGVEPFLIASTVNVAVGQRLVRKICPGCKTKKHLSDAEMKSLASEIDPNLLDDHRDFFYGKGCNTCDHSGYQGRIGIYEVLEVVDNIRTLVMSRADSDDIKYVAIKNGMSTMLEDGFKKAMSGITTIEEVLRVARD